MHMQVVASKLFVLVVPEQEEEDIAAIYLEGGRVHLEAWRPRDKTSSNVKIEFEIKTHPGPESVCSLCYEDPDRLGTKGEGAGVLERLSARGEARPGVKRRRREAPISPSSLYDDIDGLELEQQGAGEWQEEELQELLSPWPTAHAPLQDQELLLAPLGMPDVLSGVVGRGASPESEGQQEMQAVWSHMEQEQEEPPVSCYLAESASLASSDLVDLSPLHVSPGLVESASLLSWPEVGGFLLNFFL